MRIRRYSSRTLEAHGVVRYIFVQVGKHKKQFEHAVALFGTWLLGTLLQIFHGGERIGQQPFQAFFAERRAFATARESQVGADECFVEEMIEAKLRAGQGRRRGICASCAVAMD